MSDLLPLGEKPMKTFEVEIQATIIKVITVEAPNEDAAFVRANEIFTVLEDEHGEYYEQEVLNLCEVQK